MALLHGAAKSHDRNMLLAAAMLDSDLDGVAPGPSSDQRVR
jgi:hypothetical protein